MLTERMWFCGDFFVYVLLISLRAVFQVGLDVCGCEGALAAMMHICERLSAIREEKRRAMKALQDKRQSIELFTQIAVGEPTLSLSLSLSLIPSLSLSLCVCVCVCVCVRVLSTDHK